MKIDAQEIPIADSMVTSAADGNQGKRPVSAVPLLLDCIQQYLCNTCQPSGEAGIYQKESGWRPDDQAERRCENHSDKDFIGKDQIAKAFKSLSVTVNRELISSPHTKFFAYRTPRWQGRRLATLLTGSISMGC